jgi:peptidoglycan/xylan/chitin deacetylase (PgdA/CDA1 family)
MIVDIEDDYDQINIVIGSNLGVGWKHDGFDFRIGYELNLWTNLADRLVFLDDTHEAVFSHTTHDVMFDGFYMRLSQEF